MDDPMLDENYFEQIKPTFLKLFRKFINPDYVIHIFKEKNFLTDIDLSKIEACSKNEGKIAGSVLLFERLTLYEGWYACLLDVLQDSDVKLAHVAREMRECRGIVDQNFQEDEQDLWALCMPIITAGMTSLKRFSTISSLLNSSNGHNILLRRMVKLKVKLELVQNELDEITRRHGEEENNAQIATDTVILPVESSPVDYVHRSDYEKLLRMREELQTEFDKQKEKCYAYEMSCNTLYQDNDILQTKLELLIKENTDSKSSFQKLSIEKDILQTEFDRLKKDNLDTRSSFENLSKEKEKLQTELDHLKMDRKDSYEKLHQEKEELARQLKATTERLLKQKQEIAAQLQKTTENLNQNVKEKENEETKNKQQMLRNQALENGIETLKLEKSHLEEKLKGIHQEYKNKEKEMRKEMEFRRKEEMDEMDFNLEMDSSVEEHEKHKEKIEEILGLKSKHFEENPKAGT